MTYHQVCNKSNTTGATDGTGTTDTPWYMFYPGFSEAHVTKFLVFCAVQCSVDH